jgi:hypothetical protein
MVLLLATKPSSRYPALALLRLWCLSWGDGRQVRTQQVQLYLGTNDLAGTKHNRSGSHSLLNKLSNPSRHGRTSMPSTNRGCDSRQRQMYLCVGESTCKERRWNSCSLVTDSLALISMKIGFSRVRESTRSISRPPAVARYESEYLVR